MSVEAKLDFGGVRRDPVMNMRAQLKLATAVRHARVEEIVEARGLLRDLPGYATWLEATLVFHAAIHGAIAPLCKRRSNNPSVRQPNRSVAPE